MIPTVRNQVLVRMSGQRILYLYGVTTQPEVIGFLRTQCLLKDETEFASILNEWRFAAQQFVHLSDSTAGVPETAQVRNLSVEETALLAPVRADPLFQKSFSLLPHSIAIVELDKLVAGQRYVNLDFVERLERSIPSDPDFGFLVDFCLKRGSSAPPPSELQINPTVYGYRSESTDFRFLGGYPKPLHPADIEAARGGGEPVAAIILMVGYGSPAVNVFRVGTRLVLNNGFHRLFALRRKGVAYAPAVIQDISNVDLELPPALVGLPTRYLVNSPRPSLLMDFLNPAFTRELTMRARDRSVQIQWNVNQVDIPK